MTVTDRARRVGRSSSDRGSILPMVLVLTVIGSLTVLGLLSFAVTLFRSQPRIAERDDTFVTARSAMEMAIVLQRAAGPGQCYTNTQSASIGLNGYTANVSCSAVGGYYGTARNQFGVITTSTDAATAITGGSAGRLTGPVFITNADPGDTRVWSDLVGEDPENDGTHLYPYLPPLPAYVRGTVDPPRLGNCRLYYPGRYTGPLVLNGGRHYFASGIYLFEDTVTITGGAQVVAGQGPVAGCAGGDAPAAGANGAPSIAAITGRGATFLLGADARLDVIDARFQMNRRVSDATTRGTDGIAIRSINAGRPAAVAPDPPATAIPADVVFIAAAYSAANPSCDAGLSTTRCVQAVADHSVAGASYVASTATAADTIVRIDQLDDPANVVTVDGMILVPNADVSVRGGPDPSHRLALTGGLVADSIVLDHATSSANYVVGIVDQAVQQRFQLVVQVVGSSGGRARSESVLDVNADGRYAINAWTVDAAR